MKNALRIISFTTSYWDSPEARDLQMGPLGIIAWYERVTHLFMPFSVFVACGTYSDPSLSPLPKSVAIVNSGIPQGTTYDHHRRQLCMAAIMAAMAYVLNRNDWDLVVMLDVDALVGAIDVPSLLNEFTKRDEIMLSGGWCDLPGGPLMILKRAGCVRLFHHRLQGNCVLNESSSNLMLGEDEIGRIFSGVWWNPWPGVELRQDYPFRKCDAPLEFMDRPFIRLPHPAIIERFIAEKYSNAIPYEP